MNNLVLAIQELENTTYQYETVKREIGALENEQAESNLYVAITGDSWKNYLKANGSRSMLNHGIPKELDFNYNHRAEV